jgi:hypothetical protein
MKTTQLDRRTLFLMLFVIGNSLWLIALTLLNGLPFWLSGVPGIVLQAVGCVGLLHLAISDKPSPNDSGSGTII